MASATYTLIASTTLTGSQTSVVFSSIPSTYTDLVLRVSARSDSSALNDILTVAPNGGSAFSYTRLYADGASALSNRVASGLGQSSLYTSYMGSGGATANTFGNQEIYIPNYTSTSNKVVSSTGPSENNATTAYIAISAHLFTSSTAINQLTLGVAGGWNLVSGSTFYLYGVKNS